MGFFEGVYGVVVREPVRRLCPCQPCTWRFYEFRLPALKES